MYMHAKNNVHVKMHTSTHSGLLSTSHVGNYKKQEQSDPHEFLC